MPNICLQMKNVEKPFSSRLNNNVPIKNIIFVNLAATIPTVNCKIRFVAGLLILSATYVIGDMYSASLTSILARPPKGNFFKNLFKLWTNLM